MRINYIETYNRFRDLKINRIDFKDLNLLVGISGAGKTQIIKSILDIKNIAQGKSINGFEWKIEFSTVENNTFLWEGAFEIKDNKNIDNSNIGKSSRPTINYENLYKNCDQIISRSNHEIKLRNIPTVKLSNSESVVYLLREEDEISEIFNALGKINFYNQSTSDSTENSFPGQIEKDFINLHFGLDFIKNKDLNTYQKVFFCYHNINNIFELIKNRYINIFPNITDIKFDKVEYDYSNTKWFDNPRVLYFKELGVHNWIRQDHIASGMFRSLLQIAELYLSAKGTVILIDEFENSLGINCIDELTEDLLENNSAEMQFIVTSHHPYIINNISPEYWKIVTRKAGQINTQNANELNIESSHHDAFLQLINFEEYQNGIES